MRTHPQTGPGASKYRFVRKIAEGGMGVVELAVREEGSFRRVCAVKRLRKHYRDDTEVCAMFVEEARIAGLIHHPNVVGVIDAGQDPQGPFLVMEFIEGVSLSRIVKRMREAGEFCPIQVAIRIIFQVAQGLHAAHELKSHDGTPLELVHRDVSPQNVIVGFDGLVRLTDFGIAKAIGRSTKTSTGLVKGKFGYLSPEQLQFEEVDRRSDLFSLGVVFYELLSGSRLYGGKQANAAARRILKEPPPDIGEVRTDVSPELVELLLEMLAKDPPLRPASAASVVGRLEKVLAEILHGEEPIRLGDWVNQAFGDHRREQRSELEALTELDGGPSTQVVETVAEGPPKATPISVRLGALRAVRRSVLLGVVIAVIGAAFGALMAFGLLRRPTEPDAAAAVEVESTEGLPRERPLASSEARPLVHSPPPPTSAPSQEGTPSQTPAETLRPRRSKAGRSEQEATGETSQRIRRSSRIPSGAPRMAKPRKTGSSRPRRPPRRSPRVSNPAEPMRLMQWEN